MPVNPENPFKKVNDPAEIFSELTQVENEEKVEIMLGDTVLPVPPRGMRIRKAARVHSQDIPGRNGAIKIATGYDDAEIEIRLEIPAKRGNRGEVLETPRQRFEALYETFKGKDAANAPEAVPIVCPLTESFGIKTVLVKEIEATGEARYDMIEVRLRLEEFESVANQYDQVEQEEAVLRETYEGNPAIAELLGIPKDENGEYYLETQYKRGYEAGNGRFDENPSEDEIGS